MFKVVTTDRYDIIFYHEKGYITYNLVINDAKKLIIEFISIGINIDYIIGDMCIQYRIFFDEIDPTDYQLSVRILYLKNTIRYVNLLTHNGQVNEFRSSSKINNSDVHVKDNVIV